MAMPMPAPIPAPMPESGVPAALAIASAAANCVYLPRSPTIPIEVRLSITSSTAGGREMFST